MDRVGLGRRIAERYLLLEELGGGGMGIVYRARDEREGHDVAIKVLRAVGDWEMARRLRREARATQGLDPRRVARVHEVGETAGGELYLVMEYIRGSTLRALMRRERVAPKRAVRILREVATALGEAHRAGVIHRDVKPDNVMVCDDGGGGDARVVLLDFGIVRNIDVAGEAAHVSTQLTSEGALIGTPAYLAPEQALGREVGPEVDQFALAVTAYELLTGSLPWRATEVTGVLAQVLAEEPPAASAIDPSLSPAFDAVLLRALAKEKRARFASIEDFAAALEAAERGEQPASPLSQTVVPPAHAPEPRPASTGGAGTSVRPAPRRRRSALVGAAAVAVIAAGAMGLKLRSHPPAQPSALPDASPADAPSRMSTVPGATEAYQAGVQAFHDGELGAAVKNLMHATELDPLFGAAHLRLIPTQLSAQIIGTVDKNDGNLLAARLARMSLGARDHALLDAFDLVASSPPDLEAAQRKLDEAARRYPTDADFPFERAIVFDLAGRAADAEAALRDSLARDPTFATGWRYLGQLELARGDVAGAAEASARCLETSPGATTCLMDLAKVQTNDGKCTELIDTSKQLIALAPDATLPRELLAEGLLGTGETDEAVRTALRRAWELSDQPPRDRALAEAAMAIRRGAFGEADKQYDLLESLTASNPNDHYRFAIAYARVLLDLERGRTGSVVKRAESYLTSARGTDVREPLAPLEMPAAELRAGALTRSAFDALRDQWLGQHAEIEAPFRWVTAYALAVRTPEDATAALAVVPPVRPLVSPLSLTPELAEPIGRTYALAGRIDDAIPYLAKASTSCDLLDATPVVFSTWASFDLGAALEKRGDKPGACDAYARVMARWGRAEQSVTARAARRKREALACVP